jgi:hypothetical protein
MICVPRDVVIRTTKSWNRRWARYVARMEDITNEHITLVDKVREKKSLCDI